MAGRGQGWHQRAQRAAHRERGGAALPEPSALLALEADPFADVWEAEIVPLLKAAPKLMAVTLLRKLQD